MAAKIPPDEMQGRRPDVIQWWMSGEHQLPPPWLPMEERMIHRYFSEQDAFFDWTTKNGLFLEQSKTNRTLFDTAHNRQAFEEQLRKGPGVEYMIVGEPQPVTDAPAGTTTGVWNIRKQNREKRREPHGRQNDNLETLGTYHIVGENVYQAPSVGDVIGNRLLASTTSLAKFYEKASSLASWTPTTGYTYLTPSTTDKPQGINSNTASPSQSREGSVAPGGEAASMRALSVAPGGAPSAVLPGQNYREEQLLAQSLQLAIQYGDEYMDENPLIGEPGHFAFTSSSAAVKKRKADEEAVIAKAEERAAAAAASQSQSQSQSNPTIKTEKSASPPAVMTGSRASAKPERKRMTDKIKRKKNRGGALSPRTPSSTSPTVPSSPT